MTEDHAAPAPPKSASASDRRHRVISWLAYALVWLIATLLFVLAGILRAGVGSTWLIFVYAVPVTCIVLIVFNSLWGNRRRNYGIISVLVWSLLLSLFLTIPHPMMWMIFLLGIPAQIIILLWSRLGK